jgi:GNAT superfamily N-acetyltransferase
VNGTVSRLVAANAEAAAELIATAFSTLDVAEWLVEDAEERRRAMAAQFTMLVAHAVDHGWVYTAADGAGVAVWFDRTSELPPPPDYDARLAEICGPHTPRFEALDAAFEAHHPKEAHHHLAFLAVLPRLQGHGIGTMMMNAHHRRLDEAGVPAYLEASDLRSRALYERHGYALRDKLELPDGPTMWPMWREPRQ